MYDQPKLIGSIPSSNLFAGKELTRILEGGELWRCPRCDLYFRWPQLSKSELDKLYEIGDPNAWDEDDGEKRIDWHLAGSWLRSTLGQGKRVLDIGCSTGRFLSEELRELDCLKYGIEINPKAAAIASQRGIQILDKNIFNVSRNHSSVEKFNAVVAFDVIEHMGNPMEFLKICAGLLNSNGRIIISTGNTEAISWRLSGARYWYCAIPEHLAFINEYWCRYAAEKIGLQLMRIDYFSHSRAGPFTKFKELVANGIYITSPKSFQKMRECGIGGKNIQKYPELINYPPGWMTSKDHLIVEFGRMS